MSKPHVIECRNHDLTKIEKEMEAEAATIISMPLTKLQPDSHCNIRKGETNGPKRQRGKGSS